MFEHPAHRLRQSSIYRAAFGSMLSDEQAAMRLALELAACAAQWQEVPVGAVVLNEQYQVIGMGVNQTIYAQDPTQHAEIAALQDAAAFLGNYRLPDCHLFVTLEPCMMCMGAILHARLKRLVFGATDPKTGVCHSVLTQEQYASLNHHTVITGGVLEAQCSQLLSAFFRARRLEQKQSKKNEASSS